MRARGVAPGSWLLLALIGSAPSASSLSPTPEAARIQADDLLHALTWRFGPASREPAFEALRSKLLRGALAPSRVFDDRAVWTRREDDRRQLEVFGRPLRERYVVGVRPGVPPPTELGDSRSTIRLRDLGKGAYEWSVRDELAVGAFGAADLRRAWRALLAGAEASARAPADLRRLVGEALPRSSRAFGRLYTLEALDARLQPDGSTALQVAVFMDVAKLEAHAPRYAWFLGKHATPIQLGATARVPEAAPARLWRLDVRDRRARLELRLRDAALVCLDGSAARLGERLEVEVDYSTKSGMFRIGVRRLLAEIELEAARAFTAHFRRAPGWRIPFLVQPFLKGSLRRPFEGEGASLRYALDEAERGNRLERSYRLEVKESWIVRWFGGMTDATVGDFRRVAEEESDRFTAEGLDALRLDVLDLLTEG